MKKRVALPVAVLRGLVPRARRGRPTTATTQQPPIQQPPMSADTAAAPQPPMSAEAKAQRIYEKLRTNRNRNKLDVARVDYLEAFGRPHDDKGIDRDFEDLVEEYFGYARPYSRLPPGKMVPGPMLLARYLCSVGQRGSMPRSYALYKQDQAQMDAFRDRVAKNIRMRRYRTKGEAREEAAEFVANFWRYRGERPANRLDEEQMLDRLRNPGKYETDPPRVLGVSRRFGAA